MTVGSQDLIISSYHGILKNIFEKAIPIIAIATKLLQRLIKESFNQVDIQLTFQSRFEIQEWLTPYTDKTLSLPKKGVKFTCYLPRF